MAFPAPEPPTCSLPSQTEASVHSPLVRLARGLLDRLRRTLTCPAGLGYLLLVLPFITMIGYEGWDLFVPLLVLFVGYPLVWFRRLFLTGAIACALVFSFVALTPVSSTLAAQLIRTDPLVAPCDALVVLSSSVTLDGRLTERALDRHLSGLEYFRQGWAPVLIRTTLPENAPSGDDDARELARLLGRDVPMYFVGPALTTRQEALAVRRLCEEKGWSRILLVTSPTHSRRAAATFEKTGLTVVSQPCVDRKFALGHLTNPTLRLRVFYNWLYETFARLKYQRKGWA
ncbi:MAG TPA: YdcF family protein [Candidatus Sumerlaeota bacterium]|nr:YdcF family protein [Candidatus Sumerlaeota bacterium]HPR99956.1 YdcF family protein [Candidatus Sumerlaeota bacterium]